MQNQKIEKLIEDYGEEKWSSSLFVMSSMLLPWLKLAIDHYNTANGQRVCRDLKELRTAVNKVIEAPRQRKYANGELEETNQLIARHQELIYHMIGIDDPKLISRLENYLKKLHTEQRQLTTKITQSK